MIIPLYSSLGDRERDLVSKKQRKRKREWNGGEGEGGKERLTWLVVQNKNLENCLKAEDKNEFVKTCFHHNIFFKDVV